MMIWSLIGKVNGRRIDLDCDPGLPPGTTINVSIEPHADPVAPSLNGLMAACGAWKDDDQIARNFEGIARERETRPVGDVSSDVPS